MPGEHPVVLVDDDRIDESDGLDAVGDLANLLLGMRAGVARVRLQRIRRQKDEVRRVELWQGRAEFFFHDERTFNAPPRISGMKRSSQANGALDYVPPM